jgi:arylsulfatase A-like enzyme
VAGPAVAAGRHVPAFTYVTDIAPTLLEYANAPASGNPQGAPKVIGRSLAAVLSGRQETVYPADAPVGVEVSGNSALFRGDYKIVRNRPPFGDDRWHLYDFVRDPGETRDLSAERPDLFAELLRAYEAYTKETGVLELPDGYDAQSQVTRNAVAKQVEFYGRTGVVVLLGLVATVLVARRVRRRHRTL